MKIVLITPSNTLFMPYLNNYTELLDDYQIDYDVINWNRFQMEETHPYVFKDHKVGHQRNFIDYVRYRYFIKKILRENHYDKVIVFGLQLVYFLRRLLRKNYDGNFAVDIRDHNDILNYFTLAPIVEGAEFVALSSRGFMEWLPLSTKYIISHNTTFEAIPYAPKVSFKDDLITIGYIGSIRDYYVNIQLIDQLKNNEYYLLNYHGEGHANQAIIKYIEEHDIQNVTLTGRYLKNDELGFYTSNDIINLLRDETDIYSRTALPNRLYNAVIVGRPLLVFSGTYLSEIVERYQLGLLIDRIETVEAKLQDYIKTFDYDAFVKGRQQFFDVVVEENQLFAECLKAFVTQA